ncbi:helix-turn-helix domain-containing protein [Kitasatospora purpeofusca]|uniref:helix-turn-helix domain-containing protein n=1 Tax=Kitasatospora purpeofusca TaxID=67352 RepID=UPI00225A6043|nr:helix-turn-helix transcriptional regulator [Kitasatospora purpeofusca]MCX4685796.1 helix-turn-helix domain-containing protein [Kitasatospora purpeofusca]
MQGERPSSAPSTVLGRQLGDELRTMRERVGLTTAAVAVELDCTKGKISRIENGRSPVRGPDLTAMLRLYGVDGQEVQARLAELARSANRRRKAGWWNQYGDVLAETYRDFIALEAVASSVRTFQSQTIPALLQTPDYTRALAVASRSWSEAAEIEQFVEARLMRQHRLITEDPLSIWVVLAEGAVRQQVGGPAVMRAQLAHLLQTAEMPNVSVQVVPFRVGAHASMAGPYVILGFPATSALDVVLLDNPSGSMWLERADEVKAYVGLWNDVRTKALSPVESLELIRSIKEFGA